jgi:UDP-N-acetylmuramate dehydrogenase
MMDTRKRAELAALCTSICWDVNMASYSTFRTGGIVEALVEVGDASELAALMCWLYRHQVPWQVIGGGSNILVTSRYHEGVCIRLHSATDTIVAEPMACGDDKAGLKVLVPAGCSLAAFVSWCTHNSLAGMEFMAGIPGSVGGAIRMNAGAFGHSISEVLAAVQYTTGHGKIVETARADIVFSYRHTQLPKEPDEKLLITRGTFFLRHADKASVTARCREIIEQRKQKQPSGLASAGSFFKNPAGDFAGRLIERAGLKGLTWGKAMVSPKHANFIVNTGGAAPEDIIGLMHEVRKKVLQQSGILLEPEVHIF